MKTSRKGPSPVMVGFTYIGAIVGAGFASGQEILQFFTLFGPIGSLGIVVASLLFIVYGAQVLREGYRSRAASYRDVVNELGAPWLRILLDLTVTIFLFSSLVAMAAGAGAVASQLGFVPSGLASFAMLVVASATVAAGVSAVVATIGGVAPFMLIAVVVVSAGSMLAPRGCLEPITAQLSPSIHHWLTAALLYVSYNILGSVSVLAPVGAVLQKPSDAWLAAAIGGVGLGAGALASHLAMLGHRASMASGVPLITLASTVSPLMAKAYALVIIAEVLTTAVASLYGLVARLNAYARHTRHPGLFSRAYLGAIVLSAWVFSQLGLQEVVRTIYPALGAIGVVFLAALTWRLVARGLIGRLR